MKRNKLCNISVISFKAFALYRNSIDTMRINRIPHLLLKKLCLVLVLSFSTAILNARTWTDTKSGNTAEGEYVRQDGDQALIKLSGGRVIRILFSRLSESDQAYIKARSNKTSPAGNKKGGALAQLDPPITIKPGSVTGEGKARQAVLELKNTGKQAIEEIVVYVSYLKPDGSEGKSVPHTQGGFYGMSDNLLKKGKTYKHEVSSFFMEDDTASVDGTITKITFKDGSTWPSIPVERPDRPGDDPVYGVMLGVLGEGGKSRPVYACYNYGSKPVKSVSVRIEYLAEDGKKIASTAYGIGGIKAIMDSGKGAALNGGDGPPEGAVDARITITRVSFVDGTDWSASGK